MVQKTVTKIVVATWYIQRVAIKKKYLQNRLRLPQKKFNGNERNRDDFTVGWALNKTIDLMLLYMYLHIYE